MINYFSLKSSLKLLFLSIFLSSCQKEVDDQEIKQETVKETTSEKNENTKPPKNLKNNLSKNPEKIKIDTMVQLENETLIFKEISKAEFDRKYRSSNPSELAYATTLQKYTDETMYGGESHYKFREFLTQQNLLKDSQKVTYNSSIKQHPDWIEPEKQGIITFNLSNGQKKKLIDNIDMGTAAKRYTYRELIQLKKANFYVYQQVNYEGGNFGLIHTKTGRVTEINGVPQIAPDNNHILTTPYYAGPHFNYAGFQLWDCSKGHIEAKWEFTLSFSKSSFAHPWRSCWLDNQTILCEIITYNDKHKENYHYAIISIKSGKKK